MAGATATIISLALTAASTGTAIYAQQQQAKSQERAAEYNNKLAQNEARNRELEAAEASKRQRIENRRKLARMRAQLSQSGTLTTTGSPLALLGEAQSNMELQLSDAKRSTDMQAASMRSQGRMGLWEASQNSKAANLNSIATGISGATSMGQSYSNAVYDGRLPDTFSLYRTKNTS